MANGDDPIKADDVRSEDGRTERDEGAEAIRRIESDDAATPASAPIDEMIKADDVRQNEVAVRPQTTINSTFVVTTLQAIVVETAEYSKKALTNNITLLKKLRGAKSFENAIEIQSDYARTSFEDFLAQGTKMRELYSNLGDVAFEPIRTAFATVGAASNRSSLGPRIEAVRPPATVRSPPPMARVEVWQFSKNKIVNGSALVGQFFVAEFGPVYCRARCRCASQRVFGGRRNRVASGASAHERY